MARGESEKYRWRTRRIRSSGQVRERVFPSLDEAKEAAAKWLYLPVDEVPWEETSGGAVIRARVTVGEVEIRRFPIQETTKPIQRL